MASPEGNSEEAAGDFRVCFEHHQARESFDHTIIINSLGACSTPIVREARCAPLEPPSSSTGSVHQRERDARVQKR